MKLHSKITSAFLFIFLVSISAQKVFMEQNSRVIVEMESGITTGWQIASATVGTSNVQYIYNSGSQYLNTPGTSKITYKIKITNTGTYRFVWHCKVGNGTSPTDHNDTWLRIPDAADFYGYNASSVTPKVRPKGVCTTDCPNGVGASGWFKVYSHGTVNWTWNTATSDNDAHQIYATFNNPGNYTVEISMRSSFQFIDRFVMFKESIYSLSQSTSLTLPESPLESPSAIQAITDPQYLFCLDQTNKILKAQVDTDWVLHNVNGMQISQGFGKEVNVSALKSGLYVIKTNNGMQKVIL